LGSPDSAAAPAQADGANDGALVLGLLTAVEREPQVTQRRLSSDLGIALGLANAILKRCVRHGLIKISQAPFNRYSYYLTPTGFAEKTRLTVAHLRYSFNLFRDARTQYVGLLRTLAAKNVQRVGLLGASELAEAAVLSAREVGVTIVAVYDRACPSDTYVGVPVVRDMAAMAGQVSALLLSDMRDPHAAYGEAVGACAALGIAADKVLAPDLLSVSKARAEETDGTP
jgi:DNA-binding MarR family transcriptional regulator